jgi:(S)-ureidoglycine aminohydrolase
MKKIISLLYVLLPCFVIAEQDSLSSRVYHWKEPKDKDNKSISTVILFEGKVHDMEWMQMSGNMIMPSKTKINFAVPGNEEHLMIIKSGNLTLVIKDSTYSIGAGSVALLMPGETFSLQSEESDPCKFYVMKYKSKLPIDVVRGKTSGGSLVKNWNAIQFKPHDKGGRRDFFERPTAMCKQFEMHVTTLNEGLKSHDPHRHRAEEIVLIVDGKTEMQIGDKFYKGDSGDVYYLGTNVLHAIRNEDTGTCTYFAFQFE